MKLLTEFAILFGRIITILPLMLLFTLFMGRRSIGELPVFDFLVILTLGSVVGADIADPNVKHIHTAVAIVMIALLQKVIVYLKMHYRKFGKFATFGPTIVIRDGYLIDENLRNINYSIDNILLMLREKDIFHIKEVDTAIIEANGKLTVHKKSNKKTVTLEDINIVKDADDFHFPIIVEGRIYEDVLEQLNVSKEWLISELRRYGDQQIDQILFASMNKKKQLTVSFNNQPLQKSPTLYH